MRNEIWVSAMPWNSYAIQFLAFCLSVPYHKNLYIKMYVKPCVYVKKKR